MECTRSQRKFAVLGVIKGYRRRSAPSVHTDKVGPFVAKVVADQNVIPGSNRALNLAEDRARGKPPLVGPKASFEIIGNIYENPELSIG
jgi:hypothetical protein